MLKGDKMPCFVCCGFPDCCFKLTDTNTGKPIFFTQYFAMELWHLQPVAISYMCFKVRKTRIFLKMFSLSRLGF